MTNPQRRCIHPIIPIHILVPNSPFLNKPNSGCFVNFSANSHERHSRGVEFKALTGTIVIASRRVRSVGLLKLTANHGVAGWPSPISDNCRRSGALSDICLTFAYRPSGPATGSVFRMQLQIIRK